MEIKINKEIRTYRETLFFGLSVRQFVCSVLAVGVAVALYFTLSQVLDRETVSWVCIVGAAPVATAGFFQYNGLALERFLWAWLKSEVIMAGKRVWKAENYYEEAMKREVKKHGSFSSIGAARSGTPFPFPAASRNPFPSNAFIKTACFR